MAWAVEAEAGAEPVEVGFLGARESCKRRKAAWMAPERVM
jgi:hypothetical protein